MMYCEFGRSFNEPTKRSETERGSDIESQMSEVRKRLRSENRWELLQEKCADMRLYFLERGPGACVSVVQWLPVTARSWGMCLCGPMVTSDCKVMGHVPL